LFPIVSNFFVKITIPHETISQIFRKPLKLPNYHSKLNDEQTGIYFVIIVKKQQIMDTRFYSTDKGQVIRKIPKNEFIIDFRKSI